MTYSESKGILMTLKLREGLKVNPYLLKTSLLRKLQAQTLPDATPPVGEIHPFSKLAVTCEPLKGF